MLQLQWEVLLSVSASEVSFPQAPISQTTTDEWKGQSHHNTITDVTACPCDLWISMCESYSKETGAD